MVGKEAILYKAAEQAAESLGLNFNVRSEESALLHLDASLLKGDVKKAEFEKFLQELFDETMHGKFHRNVEKQSLSKEQTFAFLESSGLNSGTEGLILASQKSVLSTLAYRNRILGRVIPSDRSRACHTHVEYLEHIRSGCPTRAGTTYIYGQNAALRVLYNHLCRSYGVGCDPALPNARREIESIVRNEKCEIFWNYDFQRAVSVAHSRPDIALQDIEKRTIFVIKFLAPSEYNITTKEKEKEERYQDLKRELQ